jgi:cytochrome c-type protein NapB
VAAEDLGYAPPSPHIGSAVEGYTARCRQCHVFETSNDVFVANNFVGLPQNMRLGGQLNPISPPTIPHRILMRENCLACHSGPAVRQEIKTTHPERTRCRQCHVEESSRSNFESALGVGLVSQNEQD